MVKLFQLAFILKTQAKKHAYESNANLIKSMTKLNESKNLPSDISRLIIDPGIGFGKSPEQAIFLIKNINLFFDLNCKN